MTIKLIKTKNFVLRPYKLSDASTMAKLLSNRKLNRWMAYIPYPYRIKDARIFIDKLHSEQKKSICTQIALAIEIDEQFAGGIGVHRIQHGHKAELGYWLGEQYWGQGIMTEVIQKFYSYAFREFRLRRLFAYTYMGNIASERVLIKNGFQKEGTLRKALKMGNCYLDSHLYSRIK